MGGRRIPEMGLSFGKPAMDKTEERKGEESAKLKIISELKAK